MTDDLTRIEVDQYFPHPPSKLWRALTTPELMAQWLMPNDFEPVVGHRFTFHSRPIAQTGFSGQIACQVLDLVPQKRLRISWGDPAHPEGMATVPCQEVGRVSGLGKLRVRGSARPRWTSRGRFHESASWGRTVLNSTRNSSASRTRSRGSSMCSR